MARLVDCGAGAARAPYIQFPIQFHVLATHSPELCFNLPPPFKRGRREGRAPAGTRGPCAKECTRFGPQVGRTPGLPCAMVLTASFVLSSGSDVLLPPSPSGWLTCGPGRATHITARLDAQTPGARTTRLLRPRTSPPSFESWRVLALEANETAVTAPCRAADRNVSRGSPALPLRHAPTLPRPPPPGPAS
jgi:hypothetical protein